VGETRSPHDSPGSAVALTRIAQGNDFVGIAVATTVSEPADAWWAPVETVSNSESGFERVYQGAGLLLSWPISLASGAARTVTVTHAVATDRDRAISDDPE
jgi:alpha-amylase